MAATFGKDVDFYQKILTAQGAFGTFLGAKAGASYDKADEFFGGDKIWLSFSEWLGKVPGVNYRRLHQRGRRRRVDAGVAGFKGQGARRRAQGHGQAVGVADPMIASRGSA